VLFHTQNKFINNINDIAFQLRSSLLFLLLIRAKKRNNRFLRRGFFDYSLSGCGQVGGRCGSACLAVSLWGLLRGRLLGRQPFELSIDRLSGQSAIGLVGYRVSRLSGHSVIGNKGCEPMSSVGQRAVS
jgi:hypothetical protein